MNQKRLDAPATLRRLATRLAVLVLAAAAWGADPAPAHALKMRRVIWGFDGKAAVQQFNLLSIEFDNNSAQAFEGRIVMHRARGGLQTGGRLTEDVYIAPFSGKWVQFHPYVLDEFDEWTIDVRPQGAPPESSKLKRLKIGGPANVVLVADGDPFATGTGGLKRFPEEIFPSMVTATDSLASVSLNHAPRWQKVRARAFLDWLHRGGIVHLFHNGESGYPEFPESMQQLNVTADRTRIGSGLVIRHPYRLAKLRREDVEQKIVGLSFAERGAKPPRDDAANAGDPSGSLGSNSDAWDLCDRFFADLRKMSNPNHNWTAIHLMSIGYIMLIFPGCYLLLRKRANYKITYSALLAIVILFSFGFRTVGRRGYGETTAVNSVAIARTLSNGEYDVTQWTNVFVIDGADYNISHHGTGRLYSTGQQYEAVDADIDNGLRGAFVADIPPYSNRSFVHRQKVQGKPIRLAVKEWRAGDTLETLRLSGGDSLPEAIGTVYVLHRNRLYAMKPDGSGNLALNGNGRPLEDVAAFHDLRFTDVGFMRSPGFEDAVKLDYVQMHTPLIAVQLGLKTNAELHSFSLPADRVRVFVYAKFDDSFSTLGIETGRQEGRVLYGIDVFKPEKR